ncbi:MarR family transcriptional regulator [Paraflavitalea sp. CAU 1676]|uniref:MarR family winged helix-turn-helix transcriptional regulator n=1 Tax=Paraflavitalea sp. CAU 1676 TaxID=3032598 RepID=UPI0023DB3DA4|nr:MarR family transcriptional regulator [Paraflavitalea sp. CAU 1676]MDF2188293.1 MarR family transcriptional regulator [Paraflavitalea sp. CAU 1676]
MQPDSQDTIQSLRAASRTYSDASLLMHEAIARKAGLSGTDHKYLGLIMQQGQVTAGELATLTGLTTGAITGLVDRLVKLKLVKRQYDKHDRRKVYIVPHKENIQTLLEPLFVPLQQQTLAFYDTFSADELQVILRYFSGAIDIMTNITQQLNDTTQSTQP